MNIALKLQQHNADSLIIFAQEVHDRMSASATIFTNVPIPLASLQTAITNLQLAQQQTLMGGIPATVIRDEKRKQVEQMLRLLAAYVFMVAAGDPEIVFTAGMRPKSKRTQRYEALEHPVRLQTQALGAGLVKLRWKKVAFAKAYEVEYCGDPIAENGWKKMTVVSSSSTMVNGLIRGQEYWFRVRAIASGGVISDWSSPVITLAL